MFPCTNVRHDGAALLGIPRPSSLSGDPDGNSAGLTVCARRIGIYAFLAQVVSQRTQEIGIRLTLGAEPSQVFRLCFGKEWQRPGSVSSLVFWGHSIDSTSSQQCFMAWDRQTCCLHCSHNESNFGRTLSMLCSGATGPCASLQ